jgi:hypothetical protein
VVGPFCAHLTMGKVSEFLIHYRRQFREGSIVPVTPSREEVGHSLLRDRRRIHNLFFTHYQAQTVPDAESVSKKISIQMITLIALSRLTVMETKQSKRKEKQ